MKSIVTTYPDFQLLPKGLKQMLVASETFFFQNVKPSPPIATGQKSFQRQWPSQPFGEPA
jgi:hypothetical protein